MTEMRQARLFVDGRWADGESTTTVEDKFSGAPRSVLHLPSEWQVRSATRALGAAVDRVRLAPYERYRVLERASSLLRDRRDTVVDTIVADTGFTLDDARREADRAAETLLLSAEEAKRIHGEMVPLDGAPGSTGRIAFTVRRPLGVVCAITPFNSPLNTVVHKVAPALAAGNAVVLKPASLTPLTANLLVEVLLESGLPPELLALLHGGGSTVGQWLLDDPVPAFYAFTGSTAVGQHIRRTVGLRRTQLELGSLSSTIVCDDAALDRSVTLCANAAFRKAGQVCTSVQRLYVQEGVLPDFLAALVELLGTKSCGDPTTEGTFVGPVISAAAATRISDWIDRSRHRGARVVAGGRRMDRVIEPTVLCDVPPDAELMCEEVFGPVVAIRPFTELDQAITEANDTPYGLAAGIFTRDIARALTAATRLEMGSVHINETSSSRVDLMPYGGVKHSGMGREGPRYAIEEMTVERLITISS